MKKLCFSAIAIISLLACGSSTGSNTQPTAGIADTMPTAAPYEEKGSNIFALFGRADAEKILGEPANLSDSSGSTIADTTIYHITYVANSADKKSGKTGNIYFMYEQYKEASTAHDLLTYYQAANEKNGAQTLTGIGDEAWYHTDGQNFYFIMARKGNKMIRMKVNKVTANTSLDAFNAVAKEVVGRM